MGLARGTPALLPAGSDSEPGAKTTWTSQEGLGAGLGQQEVLCLTLTGVCSASVRIWTPDWKKKIHFKAAQTATGSDQLQV